MCEIQIIQKLGKEKINKADVGEFFKMMCFGSMDNSDAFGVFNHTTMFKKKGAFDASKLDEYELTRGNFIIGHNRFSTYWSNVKNNNTPKKSIRNSSLSMGIPKSTSSRRAPKWDWSKSWRDNMFDIFFPTCGLGLVNLEDECPKIENDEQCEKIEDVRNKPTYKDFDENRNHHPFKLGDFTLIHNGTISNAQNIHDEYNFNTNINTDSYVILQLINIFFKKSKIKDRIRRISSAINNACKELDGKYSVVLYDKKGKNTFYFKNNLASFSLCKYGNDILCGSTSQDNLNYLYFGMDREDIYIRNKRIYMITSNADNPVIDVTPSRHITAESQTLYGILKEVNYNVQKTKLDIFLKKNLGFIPLYYITLFGKLKIATNNSHGIREKIHTIINNPRKRFGWYIIKASDVEPVVKSKVKLDKMKGGKK